MKKLTVTLFFVCFLCFNGCEDPVPNDYAPLNIVEALLVVNKPIENIRVSKTLSLAERYDYQNAIIKDAKCFIYEGEEEFQLVYRQSDTLSNCGYFYPQTSYLVKPNTEYKLKIVLPSGDTITGTTTTPETFSWVKEIAPVIHYPKDTVNLPVNEDVRTEWTSNGKNIGYLFNVTCLDTAEYGKYLPVPTNEKNSKIRKEENDEDEDEDRRPDDVTDAALLYLSKSAWNWYFVDWYGAHRLSVYLPDKNYEKWVMFVWIQGNLDARSYSVEGNAAGFFGSASVVESDFLLLKE